MSESSDLSLVVFGEREAVLDEYNLNLVSLRTDDAAGERQADHSASDGDVSVYFKNLKDELIALIERAEIVVGCVAWLTDYDVLDALAKKRWVSIIVQKEDFLRPDCGKGAKPELLKKYATLKQGDRYAAGGLVSGLSFCGDVTLQAVRCVGNHNREIPVHPRAHHKFVLFCREEQDDEDYISLPGEVMVKRAQPYAVWTGSYNLSYTASLSFENAIVTTRQKIVDAYYKEWAQVVALSEPLNWSRAWVEPEWRIGT